MPKTYELIREQFLSVDLDEAFEFFRNPANLQTITPPWLGFDLPGAPPACIKKGTRIEFRISLLGIPMTWRTHISHWDPPHEFIDLQERGPYVFWEHLHRLERLGDGVLMTDRVRYRLPLEYLSRPIHSLMVRPALESIFNYRYRAIQGRFAATERRITDQSLSGPVNGGGTSLEWNGAKRAT
jgi:ligand-binding SRPBCC domain-containing protein